MYMHSYWCKPHLLFKMGNSTVRLEELSDLCPVRLSNTYASKDSSSKELTCLLLIVPNEYQAIRSTHKFKISTQIYL